MNMKAAVFSDTHSCVALAIEAVQRARPDLIIHLGDYVRDAEELEEEFPDIPVYKVRGNCDIAVDAPDTDIVPLGSVRAFITHGHLYNVRWGDLSNLAYAALEQGAKLALFGHTHETVYEDYGSVTVVNPGTAGKGRELTWAEIVVNDDGGFAVNIKNL